MCSEATVQESKFVLTSKTVWVNLLLPAAAELFPKVQVWTAAHPQTILLGFLCFHSAVNIVLRHFTTRGLSYAKSKSGP